MWSPHKRIRLARTGRNPCRTRIIPRSGSFPLLCLRSLPALAFPRITRFVLRRRQVPSKWISCRARHVKILARRRSTSIAWRNGVHKKKEAGSRLLHEIRQDFFISLFWCCIGKHVRDIVGLNSDLKLNFIFPGSHAFSVVKYPSAVFNAKHRRPL